MEQVDNPSVASRLKPVQPQSAQDWEVRRPIIEELYWTDGRKLPDVMDIMKTMYNFLATYSIPTSPDRDRPLTADTGRSSTKSSSSVGTSRRMSRPTR
jgi:hypothetical protein